MIKHIIAIYPGRFQPFGKHHAAAFKWLQKEFGQANAYIVTSDKVDPPKSPFNFNEKQQIISQYGFDNLVQVKNPYKAEELMKDFNPDDTAVVFMVGEKDMQEDPRFKIGTKKDGSPSYFQVYKDNKSNLRGFDKHGYLITAPHISIAIPGYGEMSGTELRNVLGTNTVSRKEKDKAFKDIFGWYDTNTANMIFDRLEALQESKINPIAEMIKKKNQAIKQSISEKQTKLFSKDWWCESLELTEAVSIDELKSKFNKFIAALKQEGKETKVAFTLLAQAAQGKRNLSDAEKKQIGDQMKDVLKTIGLTAIAVLPGGSIAVILIKLLKAERYVLPSSFITEVSLKPNVWKDFNLASLTPEDMDTVWNMYSNTYSKAGLDFSANNANELQSKYKAVYLEDVDSDSIADAFIIYKPTRFGNKIALLGTNDKKEAKKEMLIQLFKLLKTQGWFIEASMKMEEILSAKSDIPAVTDETVIQGLVGDKGLEMMEDGYYKRKLSKVNKIIIKRIYGKPRTYLITPSAFVNEVGEANLKPYKWKEIDRESYSVYIRFITDSETQYNVDVTTDTYQGIPILNIEFSAKLKDAKGSSSKIVVNKGEMYKVMATIVDIIKKYLKKSKTKGITYYPSKKSSEDFGTQRDNLYKAFISKAIPSVKFEPIRSALYGDGIVALMPDAIVKETVTGTDVICDNCGWSWSKASGGKDLYTCHKCGHDNTPTANINVAEGYMGAEQTKKHNAKLDKLKKFLDDNRGREFVYDFDTFPKTVVGVGLQEGILKEGGAAGHMAHPFNIDWVKNGKDLLEVFKMSVDYLKNGPGAVKIDGLNASVRLIELDGKKQFVLDRGSQKDLDIKGITKDDLLGRFGEGHGMIKVGGEVLDIFNAALNETKTELVKLGLWDDPNVMFNVEYVSGTSNVIDYGNNFLAIHGLLEIARQTNAKTGKPGARTTTEIDYNESIMQSYIDKLGAVAQTKGYEVVGSVPTEMKSEPNFAKVLSEKITINMGDKEETKPLSAWLSTIKIPENETIKLTDGKTVNALSKAVLNAVLAGTPMNEFVADPKDIPMAINGAITYLATAKLGDEVLKNLDSKLGVVSDHEGVVIRDEKIYDKPFKLTGQFIITGQTSQFQKNQ
jgi:hypothetical protein